MSTDLQFPQDLFQIQSPKIKINSCHNSQRCNNNISNEDECKTPKSPSCLIPKILKCPPAPKKPKRVISSCKRKLQRKLQFVEVVAREEVDSFFRIVEDVKSSNGCNRNTKRRCLL
ncbi:hypothetical protein RND71_014977 [Anisodus tanguticus]|uniref:Uncharacterized protein n=1 Tax=Anisodus tanguticus TaxID=243964 RepID=A0AAE1SCP1_9SOLA|nr:hypothetical protein RND71_014977 [Anisodus tanguticus]